MPSAQILTGVLVLLLVVMTTFANSSLAPVTTADSGGGPSATSIAAPGNGGSSESAAVVVDVPDDGTAEAGAGANLQPTLVPTPDPNALPPTTVPQIDVTPAVEAPAAEGDPRAILPHYRIIAYYGHPASDKMGILGEYSMDELYDELMDTVSMWEAADPSRPVMPAFELIASVAQNWPADNNTWLLHTSPDTIQEYVDFTREKGILLILDLQIGHSSVPAEIDIVREWLHEPHVHLALDPEFSMEPDETPGVQIGGVYADEVMYAKQELAAIVEEYDLPPKVLVVHQFEEDMIMQADQITPVDGVQMVIDFDGWGDPGNKIAGYKLFLNKAWVQFAGIKVFYRQDNPIMTPEDLLDLSPQPDYIQYA